MGFGNSQASIQIIGAVLMRWWLCGMPGLNSTFDQMDEK
jgi:hypothetical protein